MMTPFMQSILDMKNDAIKHQKYCKRKINQLKKMGEEQHGDEIVSFIIQYERADAVAGAMGKLFKFLEENENKTDEDNDDND